jgi:YD repeat-containing protein
VLTRQGNQTLLDLNYTRNDKGMVTAISSPDPARAWAYGYDALDRLIAADNKGGTAEDRTYAYDDANNLTVNSALCGGTALSYGAGGRPHAPSSICGAAVTYDANGNTLSYDPDGAARMRGLDVPLAELRAEAFENTLPATAPSSGMPSTSPSGRRPSGTPIARPSARGP